MNRGNVVSLIVKLEHHMSQHKWLKHNFVVISIVLLLYMVYSVLMSAASVKFRNEQQFAWFAEHCLYEQDIAGI